MTSRIVNRSNGSPGTAAALYILGLMALLGGHVHGTADAGQVDPGMLDPQRSQVKLTDEQSFEVTRASADRDFLQLGVEKFSSPSSHLEYSGPPDGMPEGEGRRGSYGYSGLTEDLRVKVTGGHVRVDRRWNDGEWSHMPRWQPLEFESEPQDDTPVAIMRGRYEYERKQAGGQVQWIYDDRHIIKKMDDGYRWENRQGDWIEYDSQGAISAYGDRTEAHVTFETDEAGRVTTVRDHEGSVAVDFDYSGAGQLVSATDRSGRAVTYHWDSEDLARVKDARGGEWQYEYETLGRQRRLVKTVDPDGRVKSFNHTVVGGNVICVASGRGGWARDQVSGVWRWTGQCIHQHVPERAFLESIEDARGIVQEFRFSRDQASGLSVRATSRGNRVTEQVLDDEGRSVETRVNGETVRRYEHSGSHRTIIDSLGRETRVERNRFGEPVRIERADGNVVQFTYDEYGQMTEHVDAAGTVTRHDYDDAGNRVRTVEAAGSQVERTIERTFDAYGNLVEEHQSTGSQSPDWTEIWEYDRYGNVARYVDPEGHERVYLSRNERGQAEHWRDRQGEEWFAEYDATGNLTAYENPAGERTEFEHDGAGNRRVVRYPDNEEVQFEHDDAGLLVGVVSEDGGRSTLEYDAARNMTSITDPDGVEERFEYDDAGRVHAVHENDDVKAVLHYGDPSSNAQFQQISRVERGGVTVDYSYDARGNQARIRWTSTDGYDSEVHYEYDAVGNRVRDTDAMGRSIEYEYDALHRLRTINRRDGTVIQYDYNETDRLTNVTNSKGVAIRQYTYNARGEAVTKTFPGGAEHSYAYDEVGRLVEHVDAMGRVERKVRDAVGRVEAVQHFSAETDPDGGSPDREALLSYDERGSLIAYQGPESSATYEYDEVGRRTRSTVDFGEFQAEYARTYSDGGRAESLDYPGEDMVSYGYSDDGRLRTVDFVDGGVISVDYDAGSGEWERMMFPGGGQVVRDLDAFGRVQQVNLRDPAGNAIAARQYSYDRLGRIDQAVIDGEPVSYSYDAMDQLVGVTGASREDVAFEYDSEGNRVHDSTFDGDWNYDNRNRLTSRGDEIFDYNANGEMTHRSGGGHEVAYEFDASGRLASVAHDGDTVGEYSYDPMERRVHKSSANGSQYFLYSEEGLLAELDDTGNASRSFGWWPEGEWGSAPIWMAEEEGHGYFMNDHLGAPEAMMGQAGSEQWQRQDHGFGSAAEAGSGSGNPLRLPGQYADTETGLRYNYHRFYDPDLGRYLSADPLGMAAGKNEYIYAMNNPVMAADPDGRLAFLIPAGFTLGKCALGAAWAAGSAVFGGAGVGGTARAAATGCALSPVKTAKCAVFGGTSLAYEAFEHGTDICDYDWCDIGASCMLSGQSLGRYYGGKAAACGF